ncbi:MULTISPECIES: helicase-related protein [Metabacillus]|uniref:RNA helicase n=2 Tax=Metabacillus TaxID=2675233 RepID=A0A179SP91_9BACI|nr:MULTISPECIES: helicase-related protein [Metabacillus]OAS82152.1 RNA helicase [Metabacillus litoralis]QNF29818.1 RNA helicase [Metabacillus sp. KUDC1714]
MDEILSNHYQKAVERTKEMAFKDLYKYLEEKESAPSYEQYIRERGQYLDQLWLNAWLNSTTSHASYSEKKQFLLEKGYVVEEVSKKLINQMFRNEIRDVATFDLIGWLDSLYANQSAEWNQKYVEAREAYTNRLNLQQEREERKKLLLKLEYYIDQLLGENYEDLYLYVRYLLGCQLAIEIEQKGILLSSKEIIFTNYLNNELELAYNSNRYDENVMEKYERLITNYLFDFGPNWLKEHLPPNLFDEYLKTYHEALPDSLLKESAYEPFVDLGQEFFDDLLEEYVTDLTKLIDIPFDLVTHREIFDKDLSERERKIVQELEDIKRRKEEEERMIEDIFGREYNPPAGRNIHYVLHVGETNTGKTFQAIERMKQASSGIYLAPLRLLALEIYERLNEEGVPCSLKTGEEEKLVSGSAHQACTVEMFHEKEFYEVVVIDEAQMIADKDRGFSWYKAITKANAKEVHIICSFNAKAMILQLLSSSHVEVHEYVRDIPLEVEFQLFRLNHTRKGDAIVCFSRKRVLETASELQRSGRQVSMIYGSMPPETRKKQMQRFIKGETTVIVATDAIGMGLNLPIRRIVFLENDKFDGTRRRWLTSQEVKQIAGRAGRKGIYNIGKVAFTSNPKSMARLLEQKDEPLQGFAIAPTTAVFERFQKYSRKLGLFFYLWEQFESPEGTKKAALSEEKLLYEMIEDSIIEAKLSIADLYGFLHLPFSSNEPTLRAQWKQKLEAIIDGHELPDPKILESGLEELELSYKSVGLHLLFLYKLGKRTEAHYWERVREEISDKIHEQLKTGVQIEKKRCKRCGKSLSPGFKFQVCNECHFER